MEISHLVLLLAFVCASVAWVPRVFDQDPSKTRQYGVLGKWKVEDPGIMMNPEMMVKQDIPLEEHPVPLLYDDDFAEPEGHYPKRNKEPHVYRSFSVEGSEIQIPPRPDTYNLYRRGTPPPNNSYIEHARKLTEAQKIDKYAWPRMMDRANNREAMENNENKPRSQRKKKHPNDF